MNLIPGLSLRASEQAEVLGMDDAEIGEFAVSSLPTLLRSLISDIPQYDYVELTRDVINGDSIDGGSKYSSDHSPVGGHEKTFASSIPDEDDIKSRQ